MPGALRFMLCIALGLSGLLPSEASACPGARGQYEELIGFDPEGRGFWLLEGSVERASDSGRLTVSLRAVHYSFRRERLQRIRLRPPTPESSERKPWFPDREELLTFARAQPFARNLLPGQLPDALGIRLEYDVRAGQLGETCLESAEWAVRLMREGEQRAVFTLDRRGSLFALDGSAALARVSPDGRFVVAVLRVSHAIDFHRNEASYARVLPVRSQCLTAGSVPDNCLERFHFYAEEARTCSPVDKPCDPAMGRSACAEGGFCLPAEGGPRCAECRRNADCKPEEDFPFCRTLPSGRRCAECREDRDCAGHLAGPRCLPETGQCGA